MIKIQITGHIGQDARVSPVNGKSVINFPVAVNKRVPDANGELQEKTVWFNCAKWETREGNLFKYLKKGTQVLVEGEPDSKLYKTKENKPGIDNSIRVTFVELLGSKKENASAEQQDDGEYDMSDFDNSLKLEPDKDEAFWADQAKQEEEAAKLRAARNDPQDEAYANNPNDKEARMTTAADFVEGMDDPFADQVSTGLRNK